MPELNEYNPRFGYRTTIAENANVKGPTDEEYYKKNHFPARLAAHVVFSILSRGLSPKSIIDFGCGDGAWLEAAEKGLNLDLMVGVAKEKAQNLPENIHFWEHDLDQPWLSGKRFDLCLCLETAEHLQIERAESFIRELCECSDVVVFSAAIPMQSAPGHINCQWQSYWQSLFFKSGFVSYDPFRWRIWNDSKMPLGYKQNMLLYVKGACDNTTGKLHDCMKSYRTKLPDVVHPDIYWDAMKMVYSMYGKG